MKVNKKYESLPLEAHFDAGLMTFSTPPYLKKSEDKHRII